MIFQLKNQLDIFIAHVIRWRFISFKISLIRDNAIRYNTQFYGFSIHKNVFNPVSCSTRHISPYGKFVLESFLQEKYYFKYNANNNRAFVLQVVNDKLNFYLQLTEINLHRVLCSLHYFLNQKLNECTIFRCFWFSEP